MVITSLKHQQRNSSSIFPEGHHTFQTCKIQYPYFDLFFILYKQIANHKPASSFAQVKWVLEHIVEMLVY